MNHKYLWVIIGATVPCVALGQGEASYKCTYGELQRRVEILTEPGVSVPCEVHYHKDTEAPGERQVLWSASNEAGYCERKTDEFIAKLEGWGWDCGRGGTAEPAATAPAEPAAAPQAPAEPEAAPVPESPTEAVDDTEDLIPVE